MDQLSIAGAWLYEPRILQDDRGRFNEWFTSAQFEEHLGYSLELMQVNSSVSRRGVIRGIHFTDVPPGQAKYVFCPRGALLDVVVDVRVGSPTFGQWEAVRLDDVGRRAVFLEFGLGHAFMALTDDTAAVYLCTRMYDLAADHEVSALDPQIGITWPSDVDPVMSAKDAAAPGLAEAMGAGLLPSYQRCLARSEQLRARRQAAAALDDHDHDQAFG
jgi:dTDP-4-dehydrorhamnose 3,5-epimerase